MDFPEEAGGMLSLHYVEAGEYRPAWQYATAAAKRAEAVYAYVEAASLYARALEAGRQLPDLDGRQIAQIVKRESPLTPVVMLTGWGTMMKADGVPRALAIIGVVRVEPKGPILCARIAPR